MYTYTLCIHNCDCDYYHYGEIINSTVSNCGPWIIVRLPSGKRLHNYGKTPFIMGKLTINSHVHYVKLPEGSYDEINYDEMVIHG